MSRYKDHRGPKGRGYNEDHTPEYAADRHSPKSLRGHEYYSGDEQSGAPFSGRH